MSCPDSEPNGLFGLGHEKISVPSMLSREGFMEDSFSVCFGSDGAGQISFGDKVGDRRIIFRLQLKQTHLSTIRSSSEGRHCLKQSKERLSYKSMAKWKCPPKKVKEQGIRITRKRECLRWFILAGLQFLRSMSLLSPIAILSLQLVECRL
ncbi:hypothetical protein KY289_016675 [Solanum tuberosum]|nr:hypothetical protein KY289_016675 [Solanum tuberosum]